MTAINAQTAIGIYLQARNGEQKVIWAAKTIHWTSQEANNIDTKTENNREQKKATEILVQFIDVKIGVVM